MAGRLGEASFLPYVFAPTLRKSPRPKRGQAKAQYPVLYRVLTTPVHGRGPKSCKARTRWLLREVPPVSSASQGDPSPILYALFHFQEEPKEEQTAMVPQAIPLRRCRYCLVLVGDTHILL